MKTLFFILFISGIFSIGSFAQEITDKQIDFVNSFIAAVESHNMNTVIKMTDKEYRKVQLKFLEGRKEQFINELFGGVDLMTDKYVNTRFADILKIEVAEIIPQENGYFEYIFRIRDGEHDLTKSLLLRKTKNKFGFIGSVG